MRASTTTLEVCWGATPTAQAYILEVQKIDTPPPPQPIPVSTPVAIVKKQHQPANAVAISVGGATTQLTSPGDGAIKEHIQMSNAMAKVQTPIRATVTQAAATPISFGVSTTKPILSPSAVASSPVSAPIINNKLLNQQGQPIIITTSAPMSTLMSTTIVCQLQISSCHFMHLIFVCSVPSRSVLADSCLFVSINLRSLGMAFANLSVFPRKAIPWVSYLTHFTESHQNS